MTAQGKIVFWGGARVQSMAAARVPMFHRSHTLPDHRSINPSRSASGLRDLSTQRGTELPSWSKATEVSSCMGRVNRESLGLADCPGPQAGVCLFPSSFESAYSSSRQPLSRGERDDEGGDRESPPQRSSGEGGPNPGHILPHLFGPQTRRRLAPSYKPQAFEQFSESRAFQDGESDVSARPPPERRSHGQSRFERCVPDGTHPPSGQEVPLLQLGTGGLPVLLPPLWSGVCASNLYQAPQTIVSPAEISGPQNGGVLGRYSTHGFIRGADRSASDTSRVLAGKIGVRNQQRQESDGVRSPDRVSWLTVNSNTMSLSVPQDKIAKVQKECRHMLNRGVASARELSHLIGLLSSLIWAVLPAPLHYRALQRLKHRALTSLGS